MAFDLEFDFVPESLFVFLAQSNSIKPRNFTSHKENSSIMNTTLAKLLTLATFIHTTKVGMLDSH